MVTARPVAMARVWWGIAAFVLVDFVLIALFMKDANAGATFDWKDQLFTLVIGVILAGCCLLPTRPRLRADSTAVHLRGYVGDYRVVPWELIQRVEFPSSARYARLVLPAEELLVIYALRRSDGPRAVAAMRALRELHATSRPAARDAP